MKALTTKQKEMLEFVTWATTVAERDSAYLEFGPCKSWNVRVFNSLYDKGLIKMAEGCEYFNSWQNGFAHVVLVK